MDWTMIGAVVVGAYLMLNLFASERIMRAHQINAELTTAAKEKGRLSAEVPIALASEVPFSAAGGGNKSKR